ncbi:putative methyltransferase-domain-containing protein [Phycomyces blakesleeanus]|uniref:Elongation factor methyltransferase 7 n=2 Tax=Phycomyces blakesleeanus TaxID=4837 RepID=A0A162UWY6_PHYB8|nr:hypothetical protein PHYBLDRAFT_179573 [Phycomyces blakesleeanus NRRL 1555(-)]OAD78513.1 hypothetical protein PHYBLDRAFT_179573 [Phycomyces blakesleeanus NRRL 1555(-)]|eukprot:XP_018296553.1 hypothetical protein PHYBLDRAFT_179573 [Phycomyces blakesleeanus NRRL 1555(-)]
MSHHSDEEEGFAGDLFGEEEQEIKEPEPTSEVYTRNKNYIEDEISSLSIRLVGSHPLWAHHLWNASKVFATFVDQHKDLCRNKYVLELGAGGALPSLMAAINQAAKVVVTDYPDSELIDNIQYNVNHNLGKLAKNVVVEGYIWGTSTTKLKSHLPSEQTTYDVIILSDLVFNHSQHHALLRTCKELLTPKTGRVYVFYTHHRPHLAHRDLQFFEIAQKPILEDVDPEDRDLIGYGFKADHFMKEKMDVMFVEDPGDEEVRATIHGWQLWLP